MNKSWKRSLALIVTGLSVFAGTAIAADDGETPPMHVSWSEAGPFGTFDRASLQRGLLVYENICSNCHALTHLYYRDLEGIGFTPAQVKGYAAKFMVEDGPNDDGDMFERPAKPSDHFKAPFPNEQAARAANNGANPPDLSLVVKAREGHENYIYSILNGFVDAPAGLELQPGMYYNKYFEGHQIGMPPPLADGVIDYPDGTQATVPQMAHDVTTFLAWASEPSLEARKQMGFKVLVFMAIITGLLYFVNKKIWKKVKAQNA